MKKGFFLSIAFGAFLISGCIKSSPTGTGGGGGGGLGMVHLSGGTFTMGSTNGFFSNEQPTHQVTVSEFYMDSTDVTQADYRALMGVNPSWFDTGASAPRRPVETVTWFDAVLYCNARSKRDHLDTVYSYSAVRGLPGDGCTGLANLAYDFTRHGYRLPTEAEWEYACRAGSSADYYWGQSYPPSTAADTAEVSAHAWWWYNDTPYGTKTVGTKPANAFGLYDMAGNVWQWCNDWYGSYGASAQADPIGPDTGSYRVLRGGSWFYGSYLYQANFDLNAAFRDCYNPNAWNSCFGFRCVRRNESTYPYVHPPSLPALFSPADNATGQTVSPTLSWVVSIWAFSYSLQVSTAADFSIFLVNQRDIAATQYTTTGLSPATTYYWRVKASDSAGSSAWSNTWSFTTVSGSLIFPMMVSIPAGTFQMGSANLGGDAIPVHRVTLGAFTVSQTLITQGQYAGVMGTNPAFFDSGSIWPVEQVSWYDAALFCNALSKSAGKDTVYSYTGGSIGSSVVIDYTKNGYRLPTEAEYEYAYRAGTTTDYYWGRNFPPTTLNDTLAIDSNAVWNLDSPNGTQPVATKKPNAWGLYDMAGNLWEWCNDWYGDYSSGAQTNPTGLDTGSYRAQRGGSWLYGDADLVAAASRSEAGPGGLQNLIGFRVVCGAR